VSFVAKVTTKSGKAHEAGGPALAGDGRMATCYSGKSRSKPTSARVLRLRYAMGFRMKIKVIVHEAEEGGYWAEVPAIPGCATQGENMEELLRNLDEAIEGCLSVDGAEPEPDDKSRILEIAV
jgi:predicted RNase H-like HicB family nuclease